jgi:hypothetical protein
MVSFMQKYIDKIRKLSAEIAKNVPASREQSTVLTCLQEAERNLVKASEASDGVSNDSNS